MPVMILVNDWVMSYSGKKCGMINMRSGIFRLEYYFSLCDKTLSPKRVFDQLLMSPFARLNHPSTPSACRDDPLHEKLQK